MYGHSVIISTQNWEILKLGVSKKWKSMCDMSFKFTRADILERKD